VVVPVHLPGFQFPSEHYFKNILPTVWPDSNTDMRSHLEEFFNRISLRLSTDASEMELVAQAQRVLDRIPEDFNSRKCTNLIAGDLQSSNFEASVMLEDEGDSVPSSTVEEASSELGVGRYYL